MSLFSNDPVGREPERVKPTGSGGSAPRFEYDVVAAHPRKKPSPAAVMNERAAQGWRVISVVPDVDFASRGVGVLITFERQTR